MEDQVNNQPTESPAEQTSQNTPAWLLVEDDKTGRPCYTVIHHLEVLGDLDLSISRAKYALHKTMQPGFIHLVSEDRQFAENERKLMIQESRAPEYPDYWALVAQGNGNNKIRLTIVGCKGVSQNEPNKFGFQMAIDEQKGPHKVLHFHKSEQYLLNDLKRVQDELVLMVMCPEKDSVVEEAGLDGAYLLVQYFENSLCLVFTIIHYSDTIWKDGNEFPSVVAYIGTQTLIHQCIIIRKSFDPNELAEVLTTMWTTCRNMSTMDDQNKIRASKMFDTDGSIKFCA